MKKSESTCLKYKVFILDCCYYVEIKCILSLCRTFYVSCNNLSLIFIKKKGYIIKVFKGFIDRLDVNFDILVIFVSLFLCTGTVFFAARIGCTFGCH